MKSGVLVRHISTEEGTFGELICGKFKCVTLELPWQSNAKGKSCAPVGSYLFKERTDSPKHGTVYEEWDDPATPQKEDVPDRDNIQIHAANLAGDASQGYIKQLDGCIALGRTTALFKAGTKPAGSRDQHGITESQAVIKEFMSYMNHDILSLEIVCKL
jgi:hypothetical protein